PFLPAAVPAGTQVNYRVTVRNVDNAECGLDTFTFVPSSSHFFSFGATNGPLLIAPSGSATFDVFVNSAVGPVMPGTFTFPFTIVGAHHGAVTGQSSVTYVVR